MTGIGSSMASLVNEAARNSAPVVADDPKMPLTTAPVVERLTDPYAGPAPEGEEPYRLQN